MPGIGIWANGPPRVDHTAPLELLKLKLNRRKFERKETKTDWVSVMVIR
jgi:hypothetical protein